MNDLYKTLALESGKTAIVDVIKKHELWKNINTKDPEKRKILRDVIIASRNEFILDDKYFTGAIGYFIGLIFNEIGVESRKLIKLIFGMDFLKNLVDVHEYVDILDYHERNSNRYAIYADKEIAMMILGFVVNEIKQEAIIEKRLAEQASAKTAVETFMDVCLTSMEQLGEENVVVSKDLIANLKNLPGIKYTDVVNLVHKGPESKLTITDVNFDVCIDIETDHATSMRVYDSRGKAAKISAINGCVLKSVIYDGCLIFKCGYDLKLKLSNFRDLHGNPVIISQGSCSLN